MLRDLLALNHKTRIVGGWTVRTANKCTSGFWASYMNSARETATQPELVVQENRLYTRLLQIVVLLVVLAVLINLAGRYFGSVIAMGGHTNSTTPYEIVIGNNVLSIPANMIRFRKQRQDGAAARVDLYAKWPTLSGYTEKDSDIFNLLTPERQLIFVSIEEKSMSRDMSGRYLPIYAQLIEKQGEPIAEGLSLHRFASGNAYGNERLAISAVDAGAPDFVARCLEATDEKDTPNICERDIQFGNGLQLLYRFPQAMLGQWKELDAAMKLMAGRLLMGSS